MNPQDLELASRATGSSKGFAAVESKIAHDSDKSTAIYRRFDWLSERKLLFYQVELTRLEEVQRRYDEEDRKARDDTSIECQRDWEKFAKCVKQYGRERRRMDLAMNIRIRLEKYYKALMAHQKLLNSTPPPATTVKAMRNWFFNTEAGVKYGDNLPQLWGASKQIYDDFHDLVALRVPTGHDRLSAFIQTTLKCFFQTSKPIERQAYISSSRLTTFTAILSTILASILLFAAIISLYIVQNKHALLGMISGWTVLFAACVGLLTNAKRDQIFAATAAYAAVLVVFVSGNLGGATGNCTCAPG